MMYIRKIREAKRSMAESNFTVQIPDPKKTAETFCKTLSDILSEKYDAKVTVTEKKERGVG